MEVCYKISRDTVGFGFGFLCVKCRCLAACEQGEVKKMCVGGYFARKANDHGKAKHVAKRIC